jgi:hypothetical protein
LQIYLLYTLFILDYCSKLTISLSEAALVWVFACILHDQFKNISGLLSKPQGHGRRPSSARSNTMGQARKRTVV